MPHAEPRAVANRRDYYTGQSVTQEQLDEGFDGLEQADWNQVVDLGLVGVAAGLGVTEHSPTPDLTVDIGIGTAYDKAGKRLRVPSLQVKSIAADSNSVSTSVVGVGNSKIVSLFVRFKRNESLPFTDGEGASGNFVQDEGFEFVVVQGSESSSPSPPALLSDAILLADITRTQGQTQILDEDISTERREITFRYTAGSITLEANTAGEAISALLTELSNHVAGSANKHPATAIDYAGGANWFDGTTNPAASGEAQFDKIITDLAASSGSSGAEKIGCDARTDWLGGRTNVGSVSVFAAIDKIITDLSATTSNDDGAERIGFNASGNIAATNVGAAIRELDSEKGGLALNNTWSGTNALTGRFIPSGTGFRANWRVYLAESGSNQTIDPGQYDSIKLPNTLPANRTLFLNAPTADDDGHVFTISRMKPDPDFKYDLKLVDTTQLVEFPAVNWATARVRCVNISGTRRWFVEDCGGGAVFNQASDTAP
jgi:hypothetical protein